MTNGVARCNILKNGERYVLSEIRSQDKHKLMYMKKIIIPIVLALLLIIARSGIAGFVYMFISGQNNVLSLNVEKEYDVSKAPMGELYPVLSVQGTKDSDLYMFISSGKIADINETEDLAKNYAMLSQEIEADEEVSAWWEGEGDTYSIYVRSIWHGIVLEQKKIIFTQEKDTLYKTEIRNVLLFYKDISLMIGILVLLISILFCLYFIVRNRK